MHFSTLAVAFAALASAQWDGWSNSNQTNTTLCAWWSPRAILLRDTIYIDGGLSLWMPGMNDGSYGIVEPSHNDMGIIAALSLNQSYDFSTTSFNITADIKPISKASGGFGNIASTNPNAMSGALLGNSAEIFFFGGLIAQTAVYPPPAADYVLNYDVYTYGPTHTFKPGFTGRSLGSETNRYVAYGAGATVNSEWKSYYFSGLYAGGTPIYQTPQNFTELSGYMVTLTTDPGDYLVANWTTTPLPSSVKGRALAEFVFVPVGENGIMVAVGGATYPSVAYINETSPNATLAATEGLGFLQTIDVYDIGADKWYKQNSSFTTTPPVLARGCAVMVEAPDKSSFNIYYYGGYTAQSEAEEYSDDVWVLSIPSFTWTKVYSGTAAHARMSHRCFQPYPGQMMVLGGMQPLSLVSGFSCIEGLMQMFNMSSLQWMDAYDPTVYSNYTVPSAITKVIGGNAQGSATQTTPVAGWMDDDLKNLFATAYPTSKITNYYPYTVAAQATSPANTTSVTSNPESSSGISKGAIAAIVVCIVIGIAFLIGTFLWWRRRQLAKYSDTASVTTYNRVTAWILGTSPLAPTPAKALTETTDTSATYAAPYSPISEPDMPSVTPNIHHEMDASTTSAVVAELDGTPRAEVSEVGMTPMQIVEHKFANRGGTGRLGGATATTLSSGMGSLRDGSFVSSESNGGPGSAVSPKVPIPPESPAIPQSPTLPAVGRIVSDVSSVSEGDVRHLRGISVSTVADGDGSAAIADKDFGADVIAESLNLEQASTPIQADLNQSVESVGGTKSPYSQGRRSIFHESLDHLSEIEPVEEEKNK